MAVDAAAIKEKIIRLAEHTFCGSGDVEAQDALTFHQYFLQTYPDGSAERAQLLQDLQGLENRLRGLTGWLPAVEAATVLPFQTGQIQSFVVAPWQLGLAPEDSVKGASKIVYILDTVSNFLASPYRSEREPLDLLFGKGARPGDPIGPWSLVHSIGMGKSSACRIILECTLRLQLSDAELVAISDCLQALLRMNATYEPAATEEQQFMQSLGLKTQMAERSRPDPLMVASKWSELLRSQNVAFITVIDQRIQDYNKGRADAMAISPQEKAFIKLYVHQAPEFLQLLEYHWQNFKVSESAVPLKVWSNPDLSPDTKQIRSGGKALWAKILQWTPGKNYYWLLRAIGIFLKNIKDATLSGKKISLKSQANKLRSNFKDATAHDQACVFGHFLQEWKAHVTAPQMDELIARFSKGYLNKELEEKIKVLDPELKATDFRFIQQLSGQWSLVSGPAGPGDAMKEAEKAKEQAEFQLFQSRLQKEVAMFADHTRQLQLFHARQHEEKVAANLCLKQAISAARDNFAAHWMPLKRMSEAGVLPYINEVMVSFSEKEGVPNTKALQLHVASFDKLGIHWLANAASTVSIIGNSISAAPENVAAIVLAPNVGKPGDAYDEIKIQEAEDEMDNLLREDQYNLRATRGFIAFSEESVGSGKSKRPGGTTFWFLVSRVRNAKGNLVSKWNGCYLQVRKRTVRECPVLPRQSWLNPCCPIARPLGGSNISKAARSKQWCTGEGFWRTVLQSAVEWLSLDKSWVVFVVDLHPYDGTLQKAITSLHSSADKVPEFAAIGPIWVNLGTVDDGESDKPSNLRIESFCRQAIQTHIESELRSGRLKVPDFSMPEANEQTAVSPPVYNESFFVVTCPNASGHLPVRQDFSHVFFSN